jgi:hypothetical protein
VSDEIVTDAPEHMLVSYTQLNLDAIGFVLALVGISMGAVALQVLMGIYGTEFRETMIL